MASISFLYSAASVLISSVIEASGIGVACTHSAAPGPDVPAPIWARRSPRTTAAVPPPAMRSNCTILATTPCDG